MTKVTVCVSYGAPKGEDRKAEALMQEFADAGTKLRPVFGGDAMVISANVAASKVAAFKQ